MKDNSKADVSTEEFDRMYREMVEAMEDKYKVKSEHPKTEEEAKDFAAKVLRIKEEIPIPDNCEVWDDKGNVIHTSKIIIREKKKEYPKTYEECAEIITELTGSDCNPKGCMGYMSTQLTVLQKLLICRDAYWKIAGEEMGLGKPWKPDWDNVSDKYCIYFVSGYAWSKECQTRQCPFAFPTPEMRDAFKENFDPDIEICKELL